MSGLLWPGEPRAGDTLSDAAVLRAMVDVEQAWLDSLVASAIAPADAAASLEGLVTDADLPALSEAAESGGNPAIPLVALLRERVEQRHPEAARWLHRGLTSQDVVDTALVLAARDAVGDVRALLTVQAELLCALADRHRTTLMVARTLTQHAVPTTFGVKAAQWLAGLLDGADDLDALRFPVQVGGAAGTMAATVELAAAAGDGDGDPVSLAGDLVGLVAARLDLEKRSLWHTARAPVTRIGDALVRVTDAYGRIANDVLTLSRPEIGELSEGEGGGSSTMPQKSNPVLSVLVRRAALAAPPLAATLHLAAAEAVDERPDGGWHVEWETLRTLARRTLVAAEQTTSLLDSLEVRTDRMRTTHDAAQDSLRAEQRSMAGLTGRPPRDTYLGVSELLVDAQLRRARKHHLREDT